MGGGGWGDRETEMGGYMGERDKGGVQEAHEKEEREGLYSFSFSCIEG